MLSKLRQAAELQKRTQQEREDEKEGASPSPSTFSCFPSAAGVTVPLVEPPSSKQVPEVDAIDWLFVTGLSCAGIFKPYANYIKNIIDSNIKYNKKLPKMDSNSALEND